MKSSAKRLFGLAARAPVLARRLLALKTVITRFKAFARTSGASLLIRKFLYAPLGHAKIKCERNMAGTNQVATTTLDTIGQSVRS